MKSPGITLEAIGSISQIIAEEWDACAQSGNTLRAQSAEAHPLQASQQTPSNSHYNPFVSHAFFAALEASRSASPRTGWGPRHLIARRGERIVGIVPCYLKSHSLGEYVFDRGWADAYERAGGSYYPKLQASVPFTPATGPRLLVHPEEDAREVATVLSSGLVALCGVSEASSVHVTFALEEEWLLLSEHGFLKRTDQQFHWRNDGYGSFEDFLGSLASRHRKGIRRERRDALMNGISVHHLTGEDLTEEAWDAFFAFYIETGSRKWGRPYLNREFYSLIGESMRDHIVLIMAKRDNRWIAGAINFIGHDTLFGRHWGAIEHHPFLHFEVCYYQAIDFAIRHGLKTVEAGAQGEHKIARGYLPTTTYSAHWIADRSFRKAVASYLKQERAYVEEAARELTEAAPFRKTKLPDDNAG